MTTMPPPTKRRRSNSAASTLSIEPSERKAEPDTSSTSDLKSLKQHEKIWFEDGSIVLATDAHLYCVHKSVLANSSSVFKDMLALPNAEGTADSQGSGKGDWWEGKPVVKMFGDSDESVYHLLMALYNRK